MNKDIRRGDYVVADNIDLTLEQGKVYSVLGPNGTGKVYSVLGPNGTGKSSLMKTIFGEVAHKGTIRFGYAHFGRKAKSSLEYQQIC